MTEGEKMIWAAAFLLSLNSQGKAAYVVEDAMSVVEKFRAAGTEVLENHEVGSLEVQMYQEMKNG